MAIFNLVLTPPSLVLTTDRDLNASCRLPFQECSQHPQQGPPRPSPTFSPQPHPTPLALSYPSLDTTVYSFLVHFLQTLWAHCFTCCFDVSTSVPSYFVMLAPIYFLPSASSPLPPLSNCISQKPIPLIFSVKLKILFFVKFIPKTFLKHICFLPPHLTPPQCSLPRLPSNYMFFFFFITHFVQFVHFVLLLYTRVWAFHWLTNSGH